MNNKIKKISAFVIAILIITNVLLSGCGKRKKNNNDFVENTNENILSEYFDSTMPDGTIQFTHLILEATDFERIIPLGNINPPGHTFPTDHIYFVLSGIEKIVYAPAGGKVLFIEDSNMYNDKAIRIAVSNTMTYYLGHIFVNEEIQEGDIIEAGTPVGISGNTSCVDFGLLNKNIDNGFLSKNMPVTTKYGDKPLSYYCEPLRTQLYELVQAPNPNPADYPDFVYDGEVTDGEFAIDKLGTLSGNWLLENGVRADGWYDWEATLSFGYDVYYPDQIRIGSGKYYHVFAIKNDDNPIRPEEVSTSSGPVAYYIYNGSNTLFGAPTGNREGLMMVQMLSDTRIKLEIFDDIISGSRAFTNSALYYVR